MDKLPSTWREIRQRELDVLAAYVAAQETLPENVVRFRSRAEIEHDLYLQECEADR